MLPNPFLRSEYMIKLGDMFIVDCCEDRKQELERDWGGAEIMAYGENISEFTRHCGIKPCLRSIR